MNVEIPPVFCAHCDHYLSEGWWHDADCPNATVARITPPHHPPSPASAEGTSAAQVERDRSRDTSKNNQGR